MQDVRWRVEYDSLWLRFKDTEFRFEDALEVIFDKKKFSPREIKYGSKLINTIEDNCFATHRKADYDQRATIYRLLNPEKVSNARAIFKKIHEREKPFTFFTLAEEAHRSTNWDYCYVRDTAVGYWTNFYRSVEVQHISVSKGDADGWIALFKLFGSALILDDVEVSEGKGEAIHLHTDLDLRQNQVGEDHYQLPEYSLVDSFKSGDIAAGLAIAIIQKDKLDWAKVIELAKSNGLINTLGFSLEGINSGSKKEVFAKSLLDKIKRNMRAEIEVIKSFQGEEIRDLAFRGAEERWNVRCYQPDVFRKIAVDLVR